MQSKGFTHVTEFVHMWEMWLVCFIKNKYKSEVTNVNSMTVAKGIGKMLGNKGGVAQSFMI